MHNYLGMVFDFRKKGNLIINMSKYTGKMVADFEKKYSILTRMAKLLPRRMCLVPAKANYWIQ